MLLWIVLVVFALATLTLSTYGLHLYALLAIFHRRKNQVRSSQSKVIESFAGKTPEDCWPIVTTQIPLYNEMDVSQRIIEAVARFDYPVGRHEIQVLDDSTDDTLAIVDGSVAKWKSKGVDISVVRRNNRNGYKAGALEYGLCLACGKYVAVFDADFMPPSDFLRRAIPLLEESHDLACLQGRWAHTNREESWLTEAQALGIDGHFAIEQGARAWNGLMMNFNGTAGIWRAKAIRDPNVGGWSGDTLTEDLDLSYRAQLAGWRIDYSLDLACPAELPGTTDALKSQQSRWATGSIQVACKLLPRIWRAKLSLAQKLEATFHLTHYSVALWMLLLALVARPMVIVISDGRLDSDWMWVVWWVILISAFAPSMVYAYARYSLEGRWAGLKTVPSMMILGCGLCLNNSIAVVRGLFLRGGEFVRTPKSGSIGQSIKQSSYRVRQKKMWMVELLLGLYSLLSFLIYFTEFHRAFSFFLLLYAIGFLLIGWLSRPRNDTGHRSRTTMDLPSLVRSPETAVATTKNTELH